MSAFPTRPVRFGWSANKPPQYLLPLAPQDLKSRQPLTPTADWIERAAAMLVGKSDDTPRFLLIPNITDYTRSPAAIHNFQVRVMALLGDRLQQTRPDFLRLSDTSRGFVEEKGWLVSAEKLYGNRPYNWKDTRLHGGQGVYTPLHRDGQVVPLVCLSYGPYQNIKGGVPTMADARQLFRDTHRAVAHGLDEAGLNRVLKRQYGRLRQDYTVRLSDRDFDPVNGVPIVIFNNLNEDAQQAGDVGVLHGATRVTRQDARMSDSARPLYKTALFRHNLAHFHQSEDFPTRLAKNPGGP